MWPLITLMVWLPVLTLWFALVALIVRPWGIRLPIFWFHADPAHYPVLKHWQYVIVEGVLRWGVGSWLLFSTADYIRFRFDYRPESHVTVGFFFIGLAFSMFMGFLVGLAQWARRERQRLAKSD